MCSPWASRSSSEPMRTLHALLLSVAALAAAPGCSRLFPASAAPAPAPAAAAPAGPKAPANLDVAAMKPAAPAVVPAAAPAAPKAPARTWADFDHKAHVARGPTCTDCHEGAESKDHAGMPTIDQCLECHEEIDGPKPPEKTAKSFLDPATGKPRWSQFTKQPAFVQFSHKPHADKKVACGQCHAGIEESTRTGPELALTMDGCVACHEKQNGPKDCAKCHATIGVASKPSNHDPKWKGVHGPLVRTGKTVPGKSARTADNCALCHTEQTCAACHAKTPALNHDKAWQGRHGAVVRAGKFTGPGESCAMCHTQPTCTTCHAKTRPQNHDADWQNRHGAIAKSGGTGASGETCAMCHTQASCSDCHASTKPASHDKLWETRHGQVVRRGAPEGRGETCAMCHTENTCLECHREEKPRDHTTAWRAGPGHGLAASMDRQRCAACHQQDACVECHTTNPPRSHTGSWGGARSRHCLNCHIESGSVGESCSACHDSTPSHRLAPAKPAGHRADWECLLCHDTMKHPVNEQNCNECHR